MKGVAEGTRVSSVSFRDKNDGWKNYSVKIDSGAGEYRCLFSKDPYMKLFLSDNILRPSCYNCPAKGNNRFADITIADAWGMDNETTWSFDDKGLSLIFVHTDKGSEYIESLKADLDLCDADYSKAISNNPNAVTSASVPPTRQRCMDEILSTENTDFSKLAGKYAFHKSPVQRAMGLIKRTVRKIIK